MQWRMLCELGYDAETLRVPLKAIDVGTGEIVQFLFCDVSKRGMSEIVRIASRFDDVRV
jgi:hypothetical protein